MAFFTSCRPSTMISQLCFLRFRSSDLYVHIRSLIMDRVLTGPFSQTQTSDTEHLYWLVNFNHVRCTQLEQEKEALEKQVKELRSKCEDLHRKMELTPDSATDRAMNSQHLETPGESSPHDLSKVTTAEVGIPNPDEASPQPQPQPPEVDSHATLSDAAIRVGSPFTSLGIVGASKSMWVLRHRSNIRGVFINDDGNVDSIEFPTQRMKTMVRDLVIHGKEVSNSNNPYKWPSQPLTCIASRNKHNTIKYHHTEQAAKSFSACLACTIRQRLCASIGGDVVRIRALHPSLRTGKRPTQRSFWRLEGKPDEAGINQLETSWTRRINLARNGQAS